MQNSSVTVQWESKDKKLSMGSTEDDNQSIKEDSTLRIANGQYNSPSALGDILFIKVGVGRTDHEGEGFSGYLQNNDGKYLCDMRVVGSSHHEAVGAIRRTAWKDDRGLYLERVIISSHLAAY